MSSIPQQLSFDNYSSYGQQAVLADGSNMQKTQYYQVNNGQAGSLQAYNGNQTSYQGNNTNAQLMPQGQPTVVNTTTYLHTPTYSPQALNETTTSSLMLNNAVVTSPTTTSINANTINSQPINIPNTVPAQQQNQYIQTISPVEGNGMNFFSQLPIDNSIKNGQIINQNSSQANMAMQHNNEQRYPSPPMGAIDINKNQCQQVSVSAPINMVGNAQPNGYVSMNQGITQAQPTQTMAIINNGMNVANTTQYQQQNGGYQQYYNQNFTQMQNKGQQQTIITTTATVSSTINTNYPQNNNINGKMGQGNILSVNQNVVNTPMVKPNSRSKNKEPISLELALKRQKNTEAARRSRMRKVMKMENLENHVKRLEADNKNLSIRLAMLESNRIEWETKEKKLLEKIKILEEQLAEARKGQITDDIDEIMAKMEEDEIKTEIKTEINKE